MITLKLSAKKMELTDELEGYVERKLARLDRYFPRRHQPTGLTVEIMRVETATPDKRYSVRADLQAPGHDLHARTATMNPHSAVDIIEAKLKHQIAEYKGEHSPRRWSIKRLLGNSEAVESEA